MGQPIEAILDQFLEKVDKRVENKTNEKVLKHFSIKFQIIASLLVVMVGVVSIQIAGFAFLYNVVSTQLMDQTKKIDTLAQEIRYHSTIGRPHSYKDVDISQDKKPIITNIPDRQPNMITHEKNILKKSISRGIASE